MTLKEGPMTLSELRDALDRAENLRDEARRNFIRCPAGQSAAAWMARWRVYAKYAAILAGRVSGALNGEGG